MFDKHSVWPAVGSWVAFVFSSVLISTTASAVDLKLVTFLQDDLTEYMSAARFLLPAGTGGGETELAGPVAFYEYDDCYAQLGASDTSASEEADLVLDFAALRANKSGPGITVEQGIAVWRGKREYQAVKMTFLIGDADDRGATLYLLNRLADLCQSGREQSALPPTGPPPQSILTEIPSWPRSHTGRDPILTEINGLNPC